MSDSGRGAAGPGGASGPIAVITGASRGIGRATAEALAGRGFHIVALARTQGGLEELDDAIAAAGGSATLVPADLRDHAAIDRLGAAIHERWGKLDLLIGNAGVLGTLSPLGHIDPKTWAEVMDVNVTANWRLIRSLDPLLKAAGGGAQALFVTSAAAYKCRAFWGAYSVSKAALEALVSTYAAECASDGVAAGLINPGPIRTRMRARAMPGEDPATLPAPEAIGEAIAALCADGAANGATYDFDGKALALRTRS